MKTVRASLLTLHGASVSFGIFNDMRSGYLDDENYT
jgi:hypothetical protein